jgi:hypothetical protein
MLGLAIWLLLTVAPAPAAPAPDFARDVQPILAGKCQPCHFEGGKKYADLPFDRPQTIIKLREKLFTRIHDEKQRAVIRAFLASHR